MTKNIKRMFFVLAIITLLATVGAVCAADDTNTTTTVDNSISEVATVTDTTSNHIATESVTTTSNKKVDTKTIEKNNKNIKTTTKIVDVNNYDELTSTINSAVQDADNDEYIINLNPGTYQITANTILNAGTKTPNIIINANNQTLSATPATRYVRFNNGCNITINNATITQRIQNYANNISIYNSTITNTLTNQANMSLSLFNSYINSTVSNNGVLTIADDVVIGEGFSVSGGTVISNRTDLGPYLTVLNGTYTINDYNYTDNYWAKTNYGNLTINNSTVTVIFNNYGNITINNSTLFKASVNNIIYNYGNITIYDSSINYSISNGPGANLTIVNSHINTSMTNQGNLIIDNTTAINESKSDVVEGAMSGNTLNNKNGNLTLTNSTIVFSTLNNGNGITIIKNSTISSRIDNNDGTLTIEDDVIFGENFKIGASNSNTGIIISNKTDLEQYYVILNGTYTFENQIITLSRTNYGNLTIRNSTINTTITNYGTLIICDDVIIGENCKINEYSPITINDTSRIIQHMQTYNGTYTLENFDMTLKLNQLYNYGNLTIRNVTLPSTIDNYGNITFENLILNSSITNNGTLIITDDVIIGSGLSFNGGDVITNKTEILPLLPTYNGNYTFENITLSGSKTNNGNLTIINSTTNTMTNNGNLTFINSTIKTTTNNANLTIYNSTLNNAITNNGNMTITDSTIKQRITNSGTLNITNSTLNNNIVNTGTLILSDDVTFLKTSIKITGTGIVIAENMSKFFPYIEQFNGQATVELGYGYSKAIDNYGNLTILNSGFNQQTTNNVGAKLTLINSGTGRTLNYGVLELKNSTLSSTIVNNGTLIISDDTIVTQFLKEISGDGEIIINDTQRIADYLTTYTGNFTLENKLITKAKVNNGNLTLNNCTIWMPITNNGRIIIDDDTTFGEEGKITGTGEIITNNITRILPYIDTINGNYTITDTTLNKTYAFNGNVTLNNVTTTHKDNANFGTLYLNNCTVDVGEENIFLDNMGTVYVDKNTKITGKIEDIGGETIYEPIPEPKTYIITNRTAKYYFSPTDNGRLTSIVNPGDILDIQGTIAGIPELNNICINKPVNIISTTQDANISLNTTSGDLSGENPGNMFSITKDGAGTNITGIYFYNTQLWLYNTNHVTLDNISAVVENQAVGSGVGQTSIRANSSYITVKNSYFYTKDNGGSSSLVLAWADNCDIINNTIQAVGRAGNMIYITTYNINIPQNIIYNSHNRIINNTLTGPEEAAPICYGIAISGTDNLIDGNTINYSGTGITEQWGSGTSSFEEDSQVTIINNTISNNKLYGGCGISKVHGTVYNNYMEGKLSTAGTTYNNTAQSAQITTNSSEFYNNTINGALTINNNIHNIKIHDNIINGNITIPQSSSNNTLTNNNITGSIKLDGSNNNIINNTIKSTTTYTITGNKQSSINNTITDNYLEAKELLGDKSVQIDNDQNTIEYNMPYETILQVDTTEFTIGQNTTIQASIYYGREILTNITKGKVTFKVNGKTLKDENGKVIYAKVVNGIATIENFLVPDTWKESMTIEAIYSGSVECEKLTSEKTNMTILADEPTITTEDITTTAGDKITLKATITDNDKVINTGKVVFKINGKSIKDADGKVIYAKVVNNQVIVEYTLPESYKVGTYTITAVLISSNYERLQDNKILTVTS